MLTIVYSITIISYDDRVCYVSCRMRILVVPRAVLTRVEKSSSADGTFSLDLRVICISEFAM